MEKNINKVGSCGTSCAQCIAAKDDQAIIDKLVSMGFSKDVLPCKGCRVIDGHCPSPSLKGKQCSIYSCAEEKLIKFCFECSDFPCDRLMPIENSMPYRYHNMKCFNLLYIQKNGVDDFCKNAAKIQKKFFNGKLKVVGEIPEDE